MNSVFTSRNLMWALALGVTLLLVWYDPEPSHVIKAKRMDATSTQQVNQPNTGEYALMPRERNITSYASLFSTTQKMRAPVPINQPVAQEPFVPPLPFQYLGSVIEDGVQKWFINLNDEILTVQAGDRLGTEYKLISVKKKDNRSTFTFRYLPMKITQTMVVNHEN